MIRNFQILYRVAHSLGAHSPIHRTELACSLCDTVGISYEMALIVVGRCQQSHMLETNGDLLGPATAEYQELLDAADSNGHATKTDV